VPGLSRALSRSLAVLRSPSTPRWRLKRGRAARGLSLALSRSRAVLGSPGAKGGGGGETRGY